MRTEIAIISALALVLSVPVAFGEIVETKGQNYDLVENFFIGEAVWESHPERIMDGGWQNYALSNTNDKVIFNTNAVGSFIFDKNSCSYSIYGNGFDGEQIIPSVSAVATYLNNGQWQNLPINDEACTVTVSEYNDGVFLTSTKVITEDITEDVFIPYTGTTENFYGNGTNSGFTLESNTIQGYLDGANFIEYTGSSELFYSNSTNSGFTLFDNVINTGYFNGETRVIESVPVESFVQEIRLDINSGFKETFKVIHDGNQELGISQTIHSGESITIGETVIDIAELNGQSFDRQFITDNQAEILAITDSVNYDFDTGIESLSNVNIIFDGDYKVNMDYADGGFVGYLEIDPTFTTASNNLSSYYTGTGSGSTCPSSPVVWTTVGYILKPSSSLSDRCYTTIVDFDTTAIPDTVIISSITIDTIQSNGGHTFPTSCDVSEITTDNVSGLTDQQAWDEITSGVDYLDNDTWCNSASGTTASFSSQGIADLESDLASGSNLVAYGLRDGDYDTRDSTKYQAQFSTINLNVEYELPLAPQAPTGLTTVTGIPLELDWDSPQQSVNYKVHSFTTVGTDTFQVTAGSGDVDYLIIGGGGAGGESSTSNGVLGGGGAGAYITATSQAVTAQSYSITVGDGGDASTTSINGGDSSFDGVTANGGAGANKVSNNAGNANGNASGSGASGTYGSTSTGGAGGTYGNDGGTSVSQFYYSGSGGGGSSGVGQDSSGGSQGANGSDGVGGDGGAGTANSITGSEIIYAVGGGGGTYSTGTGGLGSVNGDGQGGGTGNGVSYGKDGTDGLGNGGGGASYGANVGGDGGTGTVIIRYIDDGSITATGGTVTTVSVSNGGNGGSPITGYKVYRTLNEFALSELPDSSGSDSQITFTDNEFLIHGFEDVQVRDSTLDGTNNGVTTGVTGANGNGWDFELDNNPSNFVALPDTILSGSGDFSAMANFKVESTASTAAKDIFGNYQSSGGSGGMQLYTMTDNRLNFWVGGGASHFSTNSISYDTWYNVIITREGNTFTMYVDNSLENSSSMTSTINGGIMEIGGLSNNGGSMDGIIDDVVFWDRALTSAERTALQSDANPNNLSDTSGILAYYNFEQTGNTLENQIFNTEQGLVDKSTNSITVGYGLGVTWDSSSILNHGINGGTVTRNGGSGWDTWARTTTSYDSSVPQEITWTTNGGTQHMVGIGLETSAPSSGNTYTEIDFGFYKENTSNGYWIVENNSFSSGQNLCTGVTFSPSNVYKISIGTGGQITYSIDGTVCTTSSGASGTYYLTTIAHGGTNPAQSVTPVPVESPPTSTTGVISTGVQNLDVSFTDSNLPDGTDNFSIGSWVKLDDPSLSDSNDFSTDNMVDSDSSKMGITNGVFQQEWKRDNTNDASTYALSNSYGNEFNMKYEFTTDGLNGYSNGFVGMFSEDNTSAYYDNQDTVALFFNDLVNVKLYTVNDVYLSGGVSASSWITLTANTNYYVEIIGNGDDTYTMNVRTGSHTGSLVSTQTVTNSGITGLEYFGAKNSVSSGSGSTITQVDNLDISYTALPTNTKLLQLNDVTFNVGTDSASVDVDTSSTFNDDFTTCTTTTCDGTYTLTGSYPYISIGSDELYNNNWGGSSGYLYKPFSLTDTTSFTLESSVKLYGATGSTDSEWLINSLTAGTGHPRTSNQDMIGIVAVRDGGSYGYKMVYKDGAGSWTFGTLISKSLSQTLYDVKLVYDGSNAKLYIDTVLQDTLTIPSTVVIPSSANWMSAEDNTSPTNEYVSTKTSAISISSGGVTSIISATGLDDTTTEPRHLAFTRSGNDWTIYSQGSSVATTTDSTSLGSNTQSVITELTNGHPFTATTAGYNTAIHANTLTDSPVVGDVITGGKLYIGSVVGDVRLGLYDDNGSGAPQNLLAETAEVTASSGWFEIDFVTPYTVTSTDTLHLAMQITGATSSLGYAQTGATQTYSGAFTQGAFPSTFPSFTQTNSISPDLRAVVERDELTDYTTNISGMIDEYFINSDVLTATEIDNIYERGVAPTLLTTTGASTTEHDDSTVVGGNTYYFTLKSTNAIGDSDFLTPYVSGLAGTPADPPSSVSSGINSPNTAPLDITVSWSSPTNVGSGTLTGFEIYRDSVLIDT
ncbi:MAG: hypothetical protein CML44_05910, partial [Rhodobacteraceae bacterium]|nr:hypothetical protein [Paracoccaceae bacterium]